MELFDDDIPTESKSGRQRGPKKHDNRSVNGDGENNIESFSINQRFAERLEREGRFKDLQRAKTLALEDDSGEDGNDSSTSESEDEEAEGLNPTLELKILNTINSLRKKDPKIYDTESMWFSGDDGDEADQSSEAETDTGLTKKKKYKDVLREQLLEQGSGGDLDADGGNTVSSRSRGKNTLAYDDEQMQLRASFLNSTEESPSQDGDVLRIKQKTKSEREQEEREVQLALEEMKRLGRSNKKTAQEDSFLYDYLSKQRWKDKTVKVPDDDEALLDEDAEELEKVDTFESKYNFRFEEAEAEKNDGFAVFTHANQIIGHSRNVAETFRRPDDKRKLQRETKKEKKEKEKRQKEAELKRLKNLKRKELQDRLQKINEVGGASFADESFLDEDWDPVKFEQQMHEQFGDDYYEEGEEDVPFDDCYIDEMVNGKGDFDGDDGYEGESEPPDSTELKMLKAAKDAAGAFNAQDIQEELYKLDYEDIVAGIPCRFKYRQVDPESYGLTAEDILLADDKELNDYVSLRKFATYRDRKDKPLGKLDKKRKRLRLALRERLESLEAEKTASKKHKIEKDRDAMGEKSSASENVEKKCIKRKRLRKKTSKGKDDSKKDLSSSVTRRKSLYD